MLIQSSLPFNELAHPSDAPAIQRNLFVDMRNIG